MNDYRLEKSIHRFKVLSNEYEKEKKELKEDIYKKLHINPHYWKIDITDNSDMVTIRFSTQENNLAEDMVGIIVFFENMGLDVKCHYLNVCYNGKHKECEIIINAIIKKQR